MGSNPTPSANPVAAILVKSDKITHILQYVIDSPFERFRDGVWLRLRAGTFTSQAFDEATRDGAIAIDLIDGDRLCDLLKQYEMGVAIEMIESMTVDTDWFRGL